MGFIGLVLLTFFLFIIGIKILLRFSVNLGNRHIEALDEIRWSSRKPSLGGIGIFICFLIISLLLALFLDDYFKSSLNQVLFILVFASFAIGFLDDTYNTNALLKLLGQIFCGLILVFFQFVPDLTPFFGVNAFFTIFITVFLMNSINMIDNMDAHSSSISLIFFIALFIMIPKQWNYVWPFLFFIGVLLGFLIYNVHPSKIFLGDSGSQLLGAVLAFFIIQYVWMSSHLSLLDKCLYHICLLFVTSIDTFTVFIYRIKRKTSPFVGGKDHLSHVLSIYTPKTNQIVWLLAGVQVLVLIILALYIQFNLSSGLVILGLLIVFFIIQYFYFLSYRIKSKKF
ncbi:MAG: undecaprenyl/decaprenyl-phosphate alpha-N-acetylglucosaminyl 1-phosphate transferase [Chitinophagales bacterium]|jgi:UDP-GlcNAc:undecaprenyl-phosphate GlcNAc-1-phosphate transferase|nr:undecaprenyl/decaprenyl-phosphate alpha-N-acetylglucosaminyl 1-phosphate transferase [Chitinophagales bacterium]